MDLIAVLAKAMLDHYPPRSINRCQEPSAKSYALFLVHYHTCSTTFLGDICRRSSICSLRSRLWAKSAADERSDAVAEPVAR